MPRLTSSFEEDENDERSSSMSTFTHPSGLPIKFFLHMSLTPGHRTQMAALIQTHGGKIAKTHNKCDVVVVSEARLQMPVKLLQLYYDLCEEPQLRNIYVETTQTIAGSIHSGRFILGGRRLAKSGMPGPRPGGRPRMEFTQNDDYDLARYVAMRIPDKSASGRLGEVIYKELEQLGQSGLPEFAWAARHPWQSWRNRYKQHPERFDELTRQYVKGLRILDNKGHYHRAHNDNDGSIGYATPVSQRRPSDRSRISDKRRKRVASFTPSLSAADGMTHSFGYSDGSVPLYSESWINRSTDSPFRNHFYRDMNLDNEDLPLEQARPLSVATNVKEEQDDWGEILASQKPRALLTPRHSAHRYTPLFKYQKPQAVASVVVRLGREILDVDDDNFPLPGTRARAWLMGKKQEALRQFGQAST